MATVRVRNDFGEGRVCPTLDYTFVQPGQSFAVPLEEAQHWAAAGWSVLDPYPVPGHLLGNYRDGLAYDEETGPPAPSTSTAPAAAIATTAPAAPVAAPASAGSESA